MSAPATTVEATPVDQQAAPVEEGVKVFAGNLTYGTDEAALRAFFAPVAADILSCVLIERSSYGPRRSSGYGFVNFKDLDAANRAVAELDKKELDGRPVIVEVARTAEEKAAARRDRPYKKRVDRRGSKAVRGEVSEAEANGEAAPAARVDDAAAAEGAEVKPKKKKHPRKKKVKVDGAPAPGGEEPAAAVDGAPATADKPQRRPYRPRGPPRPRRAPGEEPAGNPSKSVLFVANLAFSVDEEALTAFFTAAGVNVKTSRVVRRFGRKSKGYGFVDVGDEAEQQKAINLCSGKQLAEREITVKIAVDTRPVRDNAEQAEGAAGTAA